MKMRIFVSIGVKRLKYQNTQILDLRYQKMRMMQKDCKKFTQEISKIDIPGNDFEDDSICLRKETPVCWETSNMFHWKNRFTMHVNICFALGNEEITFCQPCDNV